MTVRQASWERILGALVIAAVIAEAAISPYFLDWLTIADVSAAFAEKGLVALVLALLIVSGEIDISVAGIMALTSVALGLAASAGAGVPALLLIGLATGTACGMLNGALVARLGVPSIVATIGTMSLFRGTAYAILGDRVLKNYPDGFTALGQGFVIGPISIKLAIFAVAAIAAALVLHRTVTGRHITVTGARASVAIFSGVPVRRLRFWLFVATGLASGLAGMLLTARLGSTRPSIAQGWELDIISIVILGGVAITGGRGTIGGVVLASVLVGLLTYGLGLFNIPGNIASMGMGALLIVAVVLPRLLAIAPRRRKSVAQAEGAVA